MREVMRTNVTALPAGLPLPRLSDAADSGVDSPRASRGQHLYPVVDDNGNLQGVVTRRDLQRLAQENPNPNNGLAHTLADVIKRNPVVAYADEPLRAVVYRMADTGLTRFPVVSRDGGQKLQGMVAERFAAGQGTQPRRGAHSPACAQAQSTSFLAGGRA